MLLRLPTSLAEAQRCLSEGAPPVGGATLQWAVWQREGFPAQAFHLRRLPEANVLGPEELGAALPLYRVVDDRLPETLRLAASRVGTGAVRRAATVGGNLVGSALRCLLPPALVLDARPTVLTEDGPYETDLAELTAKRPLLLSLRWRTPRVSAHRKLPDPPDGSPPLVVATAVRADGVLKVAVRRGYDVLSESVPHTTAPEGALDSLSRTALGALPQDAWDVVRAEVVTVLHRAEEATP